MAEGQENPSRSQIKSQRGSNSSNVRSSRLFRVEVCVSRLNLGVLDSRTALTQTQASTAI